MEATFWPLGVTTAEDLYQLLRTLARPLVILCIQFEPIYRGAFLEEYHVPVLSVSPVFQYYPQSAHPRTDARMLGSKTDSQPIIIKYC